MARRKKKFRLRYGRWTLISIAAFLLAAALIYGFVRWNYRPQYKIYGGYGIAMPQGYSVHGIDVSHYQDNIDWRGVSETSHDGIGMQFAIIKATEGASRIDEKYRSNMFNARSNGLLCGAYHFFRPRQDAVQQAKNFLEFAHPEPGDLVPVLDVEVLDGVDTAVMVSGIKTWLQMVETELSVRPIIYTSASFYNSYLRAFDDYPLWVAHYFAPGGPRVNRKWDFWQHSEAGRVNGIGSAVDCNVFNGTTAELRKFVIP